MLGYRQLADILKVSQEGQKVIGTGRAKHTHGWEEDQMLGQGSTERRANDGEHSDWLVGDGPEQDSDGGHLFNHCIQC